MKVRDVAILVKLLLILPGVAWGHAAEQGFVLLLPTGIYATAGVTTVALTVLALFILPERTIRGLFGWRAVSFPGFEAAQTITSLISAGVLGFLILLGLEGPRDPLSNLMTLGIWTFGWVGLVSISGFFGNLWSWINPWTGLYRLLGVRPMRKLPDLGVWPAMLVLIGFAAFLLADIAPNDPTRLARFVAMYWAVVMAGTLVFGLDWLRTAELGQGIFNLYARLGIMRLTTPSGIGGPGWQVLATGLPKGAGAFTLTLLAVGSFDGINETFWWLAKIGVNPLEFPGRSAVVWPTLIGLLISLVGLFAVFALTVWLGLLIIRAKDQFFSSFAMLALSLLPIALAYHIAHYLTGFLVNVQYLVAAINDPFASGADLFGLSPIRVTTGFFNHLTYVRIIWLSQAGLVVLGHVWSVLLSHRIALDLFGSHRQATLATLPLSIFMIGYTSLGLWLLAAPRGA